MYNLKTELCFIQRKFLVLQVQEEGISQVSLRELLQEVSRELGYIRALQQRAVSWKKRLLLVKKNQLDIPWNSIFFFFFNVWVDARVWAH